MIVICVDAIAPFSVSSKFRFLRIWSQRLQRAQKPNFAMKCELEMEKWCKKGVKLNVFHDTSGPKTNLKKKY